MAYLADNKKNIWLFGILKRLKIYQGIHIREKSEYVIRIPEWVISEFGWYEGTEVNMEVDNGCIVITEL